MSKLIIENLLSDLALKCVSKNLGREINDDRIKSTLMAAVDQNWEIVEDILFSQNPKYTMEDYQERMAESLSHGQNTTLRDFSNNKQKGVVYTGMNYLQDLQGKNGRQENIPNVVSNDYNTGYHPKFQNGRRWLNQHRHFSRNFQPNTQNGRNFNQSRHWGQKFNTHFQNGRHQPRQIHYNNNNFNKNHQNGLQNSQQIRNVAQTGPYVTQNGRHGIRQFKNKIHSAYQWSKKGTFGQSQHFQKQNGRPGFVNCTMRHHTVCREKQEKWRNDRTPGQSSIQNGRPEHSNVNTLSKDSSTTMNSSMNTENNRQLHGQIQNGRPEHSNVNTLSKDSSTTMNSSMNTENNRQLQGQIQNGRPEHSSMDTLRKDSSTTMNSSMNQATMGEYNSFKYFAGNLQNQQFQSENDASNVMSETSEFQNQNERDFNRMEENFSNNKTGKNLDSEHTIEIQNKTCAQKTQLHQSNENQVKSLDIYSVKYKLGKVENSIYTRNDKIGQENRFHKSDQRPKLPKSHANTNSTLLLTSQKCKTSKTKEKCKSKYSKEDLSRETQNETHFEDPSLSKCSRELCKIAVAEVHSVNLEPDLALEAPLEGNHIQVKINDHKIKALIDTGASISCISKSFLVNSGNRSKLRTDTDILCIKGVCGERHSVEGTAVIKIKIGKFQVDQRFYVFSRLHEDLLLGIDFLTNNGAKIDLQSNTVRFKDSQKSVQLIQPIPHIGLAKLSADVIIPPLTEVVVPVIATKMKDCKGVLLQPSKKLSTKFGLGGAKCVVNIENGKTVYRLINPSEAMVTLKAKQIVATISEVDSESISEVGKDSVHVDPNNTEEVNQVCLDNTNYVQIAKDLGIELDNADLSDSQKLQLMELIGKNRSVFAKDITELGTTDIIHHTIETGDARPVSQNYYRHNPLVKEEIEKQTKEMLQSDIIEPSTSPWTSPVVMVKKKTGDYRFAIDYRRLNRVTKPMSFPLPRLEDIFDTVGNTNAQIFTTLDLASGFWQIPLDPETKHKSAFISHQGIYQFKKLPFGLRNSPVVFQLAMTKALQGMNWKFALIYVDDILIFSNNFEEHLGHLSQIFDRLREANLKLKPSKCKFATKKVVYLGHVLSKDGVQVDNTKIEAVSKFPVPKSIQDVRSFLGLCNYYRKFVKGFANIASPLNALLKKETKFTWSEICQNAFDKLKEALTTAPVLAYPDMRKPFIVSCDASGTAIGYVLGQLDSKGNEQVVAYGGRALREAEKKWCIAERECLALVTAVKQYHTYLACSPFTIYTDHFSLKYLEKIKDANGRLGRWAIELQPYIKNIVYKEGKKNGNADALSRREYPDNNIVEEEDDIFPGCKVCHIETEDPTQEWLEYTLPEMSVISKSVADKEAVSTLTKDDTSPLDHVNALTDTTPDDIRTLQRHCPDFKPIFKYLLEGEVPSDKRRAARLVAEADNYIISDDVLYHLFQPRTKNLPKSKQIIKQLAVPKVLRDDTLRSYHDSLLGGGHQGLERTYGIIRMRYFWPRMYTDIETYVKSCEECQKAKRDVHGKKAPLQPMPVEDVFSRLHMDILGPITTTKEGYKYILLIMDSFSKWPEAFPLKSQEATEIADVLYRDIFTRYGAPKTIISDRGKNFMSKLISALCEIFQVTRHHTSSYHPQTNSACERMNSVIAQSLRAYCHENQKDWPQKLPGIMMAYRMGISTQSTQFSPYFLVFGREMLVPFDTAITPKQNLAKNAKIHLKAVLDNLEDARVIAKENIHKAQEKYKTQYDKKALETRLEPGDQVWLYCIKTPKGVSRKLHRKWLGPYYITQRGPNHTFKLRRCRDNEELKSLVHANRLKKYYDPRDRPTNPPIGMENMRQDLNAEEIPEERETQEVERTIDVEDDDQNQNQNDQQNEAESTDDEEQIDQQQQQNRKASKILACKRYQGRQCYKVKWEGERNCTWEFAETLPQEMVRQFHILKTFAGRGRKHKKSVYRHFNPSQET